MTRIGEEGISPASVEPMTIADFEAFYKAEFPILIKFLMFFDASKVEAEDAAQKAMTDLYRRLITGRDAIVSPASWARRAAHRYFVKERQRDRDRLPREIKGGYAAPEAYADDGLTSLEDEGQIECLLASLTPTQREVLRRVLNGMSTREISEDLDKREENIRQQLKNGRDRLQQHPEIAPLAHRKLRDISSRRPKSPGPVPEAPEEGDR
jgi:RNA polymerase sigma factor (sigma-70 family)